MARFASSSSSVLKAWRSLSATALCAAGRALISSTRRFTLGNFAARLLLDRKEGVTRLRGQVYPFRTGVLIPTFHPSAALRGNAEAMAGMRADFVRAKEHLLA